MSYGQKYGSFFRAPKNFILKKKMFFTSQHFYLLKNIKGKTLTKLLCSMISLSYILQKYQIPNPEKTIGKKFYN